MDFEFCAVFYIPKTTKAVLHSGPQVLRSTKRSWYYISVLFSTLTKNSVLRFYTLNRANFTVVLPVVLASTLRSRRHIPSTGKATTLAELVYEQKLSLPDTFICLVVGSSTPNCATIIADLACV